ncbi:MAG: nucleotidyltransferase family protein [Gammaproteobacteria bacterium]
MQAIILAGGFGTRLRSIVTDVPKPMAPLHGKPFLAYLLEHLKEQGFERIILSLHYMHEKFQNYFQEEYQGLQLSYAIEQTPLGTGGAILHSLELADKDKPCFVLNGDTYVKLNYRDMYETHLSHQSLISMALRKVDDCSRYGQAMINTNSEVCEFRERGSTDAGLINAGVYLLSKNLFQYSVAYNFSFEKDFLFKLLAMIKPRAYIVDGYFIDIGVPDDYARAEREFKNVSSIS